MHRLLTQQPHDRLPKQKYSLHQQLDNKMIYAKISVSVFSPQYLFNLINFFNQKNVLFELLSNQKSPITENES